MADVFDQLHSAAAQPTGAPQGGGDIFDQLHAAQSTPQAAVPPRFASTFWQQANPVNVVKGVASTVAHPYQALTAWGDQFKELANRAHDAYERGDYVEAGTHALNLAFNVLPGIGKAGDDYVMAAGQHGMNSAEARSALGTFIGSATAMGELEAAPKVVTGAAKGAVKVAPAVAAGVKAGGRDVAVGAAKTGAAYALAKYGPAGEVADALAGAPLAKSGIKQMARGVKAGWQAGRDAMAGDAGEAATPEAASEAAAPEAGTQSQAEPQTGSQPGAPPPDRSPGTGDTPAAADDPRNAPPGGGATPAPQAPSASAPEDSAGKPSLDEMLAALRQRLIEEHPELDLDAEAQAAKNLNAAKNGQPWPMPRRAMDRAIARAVEQNGVPKDTANSAGDGVKVGQTVRLADRGDVVVTKVNRDGTFVYATPDADLGDTLQDSINQAKGNGTSNGTGANGAGANGTPPQSAPANGADYKAGDSVWLPGRGHVLITKINGDGTFDYTMDPGSVPGLVWKAAP
jgi:hypothetical protein